MVASFAGADPFGCKFVPRCGIKGGVGEGMGRGVTGSCEAASPSVCFFMAGKVPEFCLVAGQFAAETWALEDVGGKFEVDAFGVPVPIFPRCCLASGPLPCC